MIKTSLNHFSNSTATKKEIVAKVKEIFFAFQSPPNEESWLNSLAQILSSNRQFRKFKGTYSLRSPHIANADLSQAKTLKGRLIFILSVLPEMTGDVNMIRKIYYEYFKDPVAIESKILEASIIKTLKQNNEFDSSNCKTKYCLNPDCGI